MEVLESQDTVDNTNPDITLSSPVSATESLSEAVIHQQHGDEGTHGYNLRSRKNTQGIFYLKQQKKVQFSENVKCIEFEYNTPAIKKGSYICSSLISLISSKPRCAAELFVNYMKCKVISKSEQIFRQVSSLKKNHATVND